MDMTAVVEISLEWKCRPRSTTGCSAMYTVGSHIEKERKKNKKQEEERLKGEWETSRR